MRYRNVHDENVACIYFFKIIFLTQINHKLRQLYWLIGRKSKLTTENKLLMYKAILKPIWSYGLQIWGCAQSSKEYNQKH